MSPSARQQDKLLTVSQVAERLGVSASWIHSHVTGKRQPALSGLKVGKYWRFREADIERFVQLCAALGSDQAARKRRAA